MDSQVRMVQSLLERFDPDLFCKRTGEGTVRVYHNKRKYRAYDLGENRTLLAPYNEPYHVFSLTDSWGYWGKPVTYGYLPLYEKLKSVSLEQRDRVNEEIRKSEEETESKKLRARRNLTEDMAREMRDAIKESTKDVLTHSMDKKNDKRYLNDKKLKGI